MCNLTARGTEASKEEMQRVRLSIVICLLAGGQLHAQNAAASGFPPPGQLVDIRGRKLHLYCTGEGHPTVILVAGGGAYSIDWALVQPKIAKVARVCSYDRAGLAWSDPGPADETAEQTVNDLHALLRAAKQQGPYVLVGASIGGIFITAYQRAHPEEVAGLVFTNSANRVGFSVKGKGDLIWKLSEEDLRSGYPLPSSIRPPKPSREEEPFDRLPANLQAVRLWLDVRLWGAWDPSKATADSLLSWRREFLKLFDATDAGKQAPLGDLPVVVLSSGPEGTAAERQTRDGAGARLDFLSRNTAHIAAAGSGHEIHLYMPDMVVEAIARALSAVNEHVPLVNR